MPMGRPWLSRISSPHAAKYCWKPHYMKYARIWPQLSNASLLMHSDSAKHLYTVEPLSVQAFVLAVAAAGRGALVLDIGSIIGAYSVFAASMGAHAIAVDMQPLCAWFTECNLRLNHLSGDVRLGYVTSNASSGTVAVPDDECSVMASPTAVAGRHPHGLLQRKTRILDGLDNRKHLLNPKMALTPVPALPIGAELLAGHERPPVAVAKIECAARGA
eukprot:7039220-Prymnesium_polylepis.1